VLPNGSFDLATPPWVQDPVTPSLLCGMPLITPFDGTQAGCLGGVDGTIQTLSQDFPLPQGAKALTLSGQICIATAETQSVDHDTVQLDVLDGTAVIASFDKFTNRQGTTNCVFMPFNLSAAAASDPVTATLRIRSTLDANMPTSFYIDGLKLVVDCTH
jgi:hypothetical protein